MIYVLADHVAGHNATSDAIDILFPIFIVGVIVASVVMYLRGRQGK